MFGLSVILWIILAAWTLLIVYIIIDVRRVMGRNNATNAKLLGILPPPVTARGVMINRLALTALLVVSNWAIWHFGLRL
jgi:hypothetical protein